MMPYDLFAELIEYITLICDWISLIEEMVDLLHESIMADTHKKRSDIELEYICWSPIVLRYRSHKVLCPSNPE